MTSSLRPSTAAESEALYAIWRGAVEATHTFLAPDDLEFYAAMLRRDYLPQGGFMVAVTADDAPLAFMKMEGDTIDALFVAPAHHGQGLGRALVEHAAQGQTALRVSVNEQNAGARAFYRRLGFRPIGRSALDPCGRPYPLLHLRREG